MEVSCTKFSFNCKTPSQRCRKRIPANLRPSLLFSMCLVVLCLCKATAQDNNDDYHDPDQEQDSLLHSSSRGSIVSPAYDAKARDFTARCLRLAQYSGPKACEIFLACCSEENVLNKLNGDRCQRADSTNGCTPNFQGDGVQWSQCRAFNCTEEITTTSTTTLASPSSSSYTTSSRIHALMTLTTSSLLLLVLPLLI